MWWIPFAAFLIHLLLSSLRVRAINEEPIRHCVREGKPFVFAFWHGSMLFGWWYLRKHRPAALVSQSKDGEILSGILANWGFTVVRGSTSKGGKAAMDEMRRLISEGFRLCITPDGPRGPRGEMKMGALRAAQTGGVPLFLCSIGYKSVRFLKSWDRFEIPLPMSKTTVAFSDPIIIAPELSGPALDDIRSAIERQLRTMDTEVKGFRH